MSLLVQLIKRKKDIKKREPEEVQSDSSKEMKKLFDNRRVSIEDLVSSTYNLGKYTAEAFALQCCSPRNYKDLDRINQVYSHVALMLGECGGALQHEINSKYGKGADDISQKLVEMAISGGRSKKEVEKMAMTAILELSGGDDGPEDS